MTDQLGDEYASDVIHVNTDILVGLIVSELKTCVVVFAADLYVCELQTFGQYTFLEPMKISLITSCPNQQSVIYLVATFCKITVCSRPRTDQHPISF